jgi:hypothetical protein
LDQQKADGLPYETRLQVDGEYFVSTNIDVQDGLFNGATGTLKMIEYENNNQQIPKRAWLDFRHPLIGSARRTNTRSYQAKKNINMNWVAVDKLKRNLSKTGRHHGLKIIRKQIPLVAANGITINKAQGSSLICAVVCVKRRNGRKLTRERLYVGCSRATTKDGLFIDGVFEPPNPPPPDDKVTLEMEKLRRVPMQFSIKFLQDYDESFNKIYFHNVQSFILHHADVQADHCPMSSDFVALVEPKLLRSDVISLNGYDCIFRKNSRKSPANSEGALLFQRTNGEFLFFKEFLKLTLIFF